jgi:hypothetical protein
MRKKVLPWTRIAAVVRRLSYKNGLELPVALKEVSGEPFERDLKRLEALAEFLEKLADKRAPRPRPEKPG